MHESDNPLYKDIPLKPTRKIIARNMQASLQNMAQLTLNRSFDGRRLLAARALCKASPDADIQKITLNDMILFSVSRVLPNHPMLNSHYMGDFIRVFQTVNLGIAIDTPRGLLVPNIFQADSMTLAELSKAAKALIRDARSGTLERNAFSNGSFTVTNLGALGIESFTPINNPPQTGILGVCAAVNRLAADGSVYPAIGLSLTFDHRALDGAPAASFLNDLSIYLANFDLKLAG